MSLNDSKNDGEDPNYVRPNPFEISASVANPNMNLNMFGPMYGLPVPSGKSPEYLAYNIKGRSWNENMVYSVGSTYLLGIVFGGSYGVVDGFRNAPSNKFNIRLNSVLNKGGRGGSRAGNALGSLAFLYSCSEGLWEFFELDRKTRNVEWVGPAICAGVTGMIYKSTMGPKTCVLAGAIGCGVALTSSAIKSFMPNAGLSNSKKLLFF